MKHSGCRCTLNPSLFFSFNFIQNHQYIRDLHCVFGFLETVNFKGSAIFGSLNNHINFSYFPVGKIIIDCIPQHIFLSVSQLPDERITMKPFRLKLNNTLWNTETTIQKTIFQSKYWLKKFRISLTAFPIKLNYFGLNSLGRYFSSTICAWQIIVVLPQNIAYIFFTKGWGLFPTHMRPGACFLNHSIMILSRMFTQYRLYSFTMFRFQYY